MPNPRVVALQVRNASTNEAGWTPTVASNKATYSYRYTGGHDGAGGMTFIVGRGADKFEVGLHEAADARYRIHSITFEGDHPDEAQLGHSFHDDGSHHVHNRNTKAIDAKYKVTVRDASHGGVLIPCDPPISNKQPQ